MKKLGLILMILAMGMTGFAQKSAAPEETGTMSTTHKANAPEWGAEMTTNFVQKAMMGGMMEKELGQMAVRRGNSQDVKDLGMMLAKNHSNADMKLEDIAEDMNISIPDKLDREHQQTLDQLKLKSDNEFSKAFVNLVIKNHENDIAAFKNAEDRLPEGKLDEWVENTIPVMQKHLSKAESIKDNWKNCDVKKNEKMNEQK